MLITEISIHDDTGDRIATIKWSNTGWETQLENTALTYEEMQKIANAHKYIDSHLNELAEYILKEKNATT